MKIISEESLTKLEADGKRKIATTMAETEVDTKTVENPSEETKTLEINRHSQFWWSWKMDKVHEFNKHIGEDNFTDTTPSEIPEVRDVIAELELEK